MDDRRPAHVLPLSLVATCLVVAMVAYPETAFQAALRGLMLWWEVVFPALLPFFIGGQLLMGLGVVHFVGVLLQPLMRPVFNLPGVGGFVTAMGLASGYPIGALLTARLRRDGAITAAEGERLMSFANTADPLFMAGAVAVGMFGQPEVAGTLVAAHYLAAVLTGLALRFHRPGDPPSPPPAAGRSGTILGRATGALIEAHRRDGRALGHLLGDCVRESVQTLLVIGGFIILFSVLLQVLGTAGLTGALTGLGAWLLQSLRLDPDTSSALVAGLFEITLGSQFAAQADAALLDRLVTASAVIAWAGLSVHAQVAALIAGTGMSLRPYITARLLHAALAGACTVGLVRLNLQPAALGLPPARMASAALAVGFGDRLLGSLLAWVEATAAALVLGAAVGLAAGLAGARAHRC